MRPELRLRVDRAEIEASSLRVGGERHHYLTRVRRVAVGDELELFDGEGRSRLARVVSVNADEVVLEASDSVVTTAPPAVRVVSLLPLIKGERLDFAIAKLTEIGVSEVVPIRCERSVVHLEGARAERRRQRFERVAVDAARQSGRSDVPTISPISDFGEALSRPVDSMKLVFVPDASLGLRRRLHAEEAPQGVALLTGPEGGLTRAEVQAATEAGFEAVSLGPRILRAETAALVAATAVLTLVGDIGR